MTSEGEARARLRIDRPTPARMYDYCLGGKDNFEVDRQAAEELYAKIGYVPKEFAWENRKFLWRAVEHIAREQRISQFIDVGAGLPTVRNTHEIVQDVNPDARVVYVDNDPIVVSHGRALLATNANTAVVDGDAADPAGILSDPETTRLIDFGQPVALLFVALLHFLTTPDHHRHVPGTPTPAEIVAAFTERAAPGSVLVITHVTTEGVPEDKVAVLEDVFDHVSSPMTFRPREEIEKLFAGWRMLPPGLVRPWQWPSDSDLPRTPYFLAGVATKELPGDRDRE